MVVERGLYSIGEAAKLANVSRKALRFYDSIGVISPDKVDDNNYRYYSKDTLLTAPVIKYYKQMGFQIDEMQCLIKGTTPNTISKIFLDKLDERTKELELIEHQYLSIKDWNAMLTEALCVLEKKTTDVSFRFCESQELLFLEQPYCPDDRESIINIEFTNFIESIDNKITGPVIRHFEDIYKRLNNEVETQVILQKPLKVSKNLNELRSFGGAMVLSCYHIGPHAHILESYQRLISWAKEYSFLLHGNVYERYLIDWWLTGDEENFVTEIIAEVIP